MSTLHVEVIVSSCLGEEGWRKQKISVGEKRNGYVCRRNGSADDASESCASCKVLCKSNVLYKEEGVGENQYWRGGTSGKICQISEPEVGPVKSPGMRKSEPAVLQLQRSEPMS